MLLTIHVQIGKSHRSHMLIYVRHPLLQAVQKLQFRQSTSAFRYTSIPYEFAKYSGLSVGKPCKDRFFFHAIINLKCIHATGCVSAAHLEFRLYCISAFSKCE